MDRKATTKITETEQKIIQASTKLFLQKGFDQTSIRDISKEAGVNLALVNYYFKSKENLPEIILKYILQDSTQRLNTILTQKAPLEKKIKSFVYKLHDILIEDTDIVLFFLSYLQRDTKKMLEIDFIKFFYNPVEFEKQVKAERKKGTINKVDPEQLYLNILSLCIFPFAVSSMVADKNNFSREKLEKFLKARKKIVYNTIMASLSPSFSMDSEK